MTLRIVAWNDIEQRLVRTSKDPADIIGSIVLDTVDADSVSIPLGATSVSATYSYTFGSADSYALVVNLTNLIDSSVQYQPVIVTSKTTSGFTAIWNVPTDTANYKIDYIAVSPVLSFIANVESILNNTTSHTALLLSAASYATIPQVVNEIDATPFILHPVCISSKTSTDFTTKWNMPTDSSNYKMHWMASYTSSAMLKSGVKPISTLATTATVSFAFPALSSGSYVVIPRMSNLTDGSSLLQQVVVTEKTLTSFTAKWNQPVDSANYRLDWILKTT